MLLLSIIFAFSLILNCVQAEDDCPFSSTSESSSSACHNGWIKFKNDLDAKLISLRESVYSLEQNPVPLGFIYVQLSGEPDPKDLWPNIGWKDVTSKYAGLFFRAEGGDSAVFGEVQSDNAPRLINVYHWDHPIESQHWNWNGPVSIPVGKISSPLYSDEKVSLKDIKFETSCGEVRPRNMAIRIWKRIGHVFV